MSDLNRFSSRRKRLDKVFLADRLKGAISYRRIAGYFRSSIFELVGEEIANIPDVRILCNSELDVADIAISKLVRETALKEKWNQVPVETEALLYREQYRKLHELLTAGNVQIRVVPKNKVFLHGKAGVIELADGRKTSFLGSINETKSAFTTSYEILWEDPSTEGVKWVEEEFEALWADSYELPDAIVEEVRRVVDRVEVHFDDVSATEMPAAAIAEAPIYRGGEQLQPWQRSFIAEFLEHRETYGKARLLLADEVGLGKTLSLAGAGMVSAMLGDGPVLILCPSTLTFQWQVELKDRLGIPSAVWSSNKKVWVDPSEHIIRTNGARDVVKCPYQVAIVSTGLIFSHGSEEREALLRRKFGTIILDEAHRARRRGGLGDGKGEPNFLLDFMLRIAPRTKNLLLGTATPIQTDVRELWDLLAILNSGEEFVLGREMVSIWAKFEQALPFVKGEAFPANEREAWELLRNPLPPPIEAYTLRSQMGIDDTTFFSDRPFMDLGFVEQEEVRKTMEPGYFRNNNPILRHTVLRRRGTLEEQGLLPKIAVDVHPDTKLGAAVYPSLNFVLDSRGVCLGLMTNHPFDQAYRAAEEFTESLRTRTRAAGFMKTLLLQRICSSFESGRKTAEKMLKRELIEDEENSEKLNKEIGVLTQTEAGHLQNIINELSRPEARDPKFGAVKYFLNEHQTEKKTWLELGCIIFSQYYDTAYWIASELAKDWPAEAIAVYAGAGKSGLFREGQFVNVNREQIKTSVKAREIRLVVATDAACEGLNLQTLGTLINVDLPWNPSRLEQRLGRIKRIGQVRTSVDMLNLVYHETQDERIYSVLSSRLKDKFDIFGSLPDTIEDDWIENVEELDARVDQYIHERERAKNAFELRYEGTIEPDSNRWELCARVLSRKDVISKLSEPW